MRSLTKRIISAFLIMTLMVVMLPISSMSFATVSKAESNDIDTAYEIQFGEQTTKYFDKDDVHWFKLVIPKGIRNQTIKMVIMGKTDFQGKIQLSIYNSSLEKKGTYSSASANSSGTTEMTISHQNITETIYIKIDTVFGWYGGAYGNYIFKVIGDYDKSSKLSVSTQKGKKSIIVSTIDGANVVISLNKAIIKNKKKKVKKITINSGNGKVKIKLSRNLKKGDKIKITVKKSGYETKKITKKIV